MLKPADLQRNPHALSQTLSLKNGARVLWRLLLAEEGERLVHYFENLSEATRRVYGPHPFTAEQARLFCAEIDYGHTLRFVALDPQFHCTLAPSVADAYQARGLGSALLPVLINTARRLGRTHIALWGGVRADNPRAEHFYRKFGFVELGQFEAGGSNNYDMLLAL